ncbi:MAG: translation initiation factor IF-2 [Oscillospiraceae bacterium]|nr:translation initiation factor IF-2 [Oscillospiraceae bacterium]
MSVKYKVTDLAKDLATDKNDIIELLASLTGETKKPTANLSEQELSLVFDRYTEKYAVADLNTYFSTKTPSAVAGKKEEAPKEKAEKKPAEKPAEKKPAEQKKEAAAPKKAAESKHISASAPQKAETPAKEEPRQPEVMVKRPPKPQMPNIVSQPKPAPARPQATPAPGVKPPVAEKAKQPEKKPAPAPAKPVENKPKGASYTPPSERKKQVKQPAKAKEQFNEIIRPLGGLSQSSEPAAETRRVVDTRGDYVDLEKYNERYDRAADSSNRVREMAVSKQKINQKTQKNRKYKRDNEAEKMRKIQMEKQRRERLQITVGDEITVGDLALKLKINVAEIVKRLMALGVFAAASDVIDFDTASMVAIEIGAKVEKEVVVTIEDRLIDDTEDVDDNLQPRDPVVVVMGHVDHGKTSLLDAIRSSNVTSTEAGGITQHIGASRVSINDRELTFLDTPGHAAFTSMRARGAQATDIAVLVVAADDGIMPQTIEAINHAKAADVPIIVAINKMDKPTANIDRVKTELAEHDLICEDWGGDVICVPVSALKRQNIDSLLEMILLVADMRELKANPNRRAKGVVIESKLDKGRGPLATVLVQNGTLRVGDVVICGATVGHVRAMNDDKGRAVTEAGPSVPVEIVGLDAVPEAGDVLNAVADERLARQLVDQRKSEEKAERFASYQKVTLENLFSQIEQGEVKELPIIVKADVNGSVEAVKQSLEKLSCDEVRVRVIHGGVGAVTESDIMLANASNAIIIGFNVRPEPLARDSAARDGVELRLYRVIYDAINDVQTAIKGMLAPKYRDVDLGRAEVRQVYHISSVGTVAGCYVTEGKITRNAHIRVVRDGIIIADDLLSSLKRFKDDVKEVVQGYECGMSLEKYSDVKEGDFFEAYMVEEYRD